MAMYSQSPDPEIPLVCVNAMLKKKSAMAGRHGQPLDAQQQPETVRPPSQGAGMGLGSNRLSSVRPICYP